MVRMEEGAVQQQWGSCGFGGVSFIGVTVVPGKGATLVGVQMEPGDKWRCQGEHEAVKVVIGIKIAKGKYFLAGLQQPVESALDPFEDKSD